MIGDIVTLFALILELAGAILIANAYVNIRGSRMYKLRKLVLGFFAEIFLRNSEQGTHKVLQKVASLSDDNIALSFRGVTFLFVGFLLQACVLAFNIFSAL